LVDIVDVQIFGSIEDEWIYNIDTFKQNKLRD
jgi:hypothetical protein